MKENTGNLSIKAEQLEWRRSKIIELRARGLSYMEIARELQVSKTVIGEDMLYLRNHARENIKEYTTQHLPEQYQICLSALDTILKRQLGNVFHTKDIEAAIEKDSKYNPDDFNPYYFTPKSMGIDPAYGSSAW